MNHKIINPKLQMGCVQTRKDKPFKGNTNANQQIGVRATNGDMQVIQKQQIINPSKKSIHFVSLKTRQDNIPSGSTIQSFHELNKKDCDYERKLQNRQKSEIYQFCKKCQYNYQQHNIDMAYHYSQLAGKKWNKAQENKIFNQMQVEFYSKLFKKVERQYKDVISYNEEIEKGGWIQQSFKKGIKVSSRMDGDTVGVLAEGIIQVPFQYFISVLTEIDLYKQYTPFMQKSNMEKDVARNCKVGYSTNKFPFLTVRQSFFQATGYNRLDTDGTLFLYTRSIQHRKDLHQELQYTPKMDPKAISVIYNYFVLKYYPICKGKGRVVVAINGDMQINLVPLFILKLLAIDFGHSFIQSVLDASRQFKGSKWQENVKKDPRLYNFFKQAIDQYLTKMGK